MKYSSTKRGKIKSISLTRGTALIAVLIQGITVPVYCQVEGRQSSTINSGQYVTIEFVKDNGKVIIKSLKKNRNVVKCVAI